MRTRKRARGLSCSLTLSATYLQIYCVASNDVPLVAVGARSLKAEHALVRDLELLVTHPLQHKQMPTFRRQRTKVLWLGLAECNRMHLSRTVYQNHGNTFCEERMVPEVLWSKGFDPCAGPSETQLVSTRSQTLAQKLRQLYRRAAPACIV